MTTRAAPLPDTPPSAADWFMRLTAAPEDAALQADFEAWRVASPAHRQEWAEMTETVAALGRLRASYRAEGAASRPLARARRRRGHRRRLGWSAGVVSLAAAACLAVWLLPGLLTRLQADYATGTGETRVVALADGSRIDLAPESAIALEGGPEGRHLRLLKGEAFFRVAHDPAHPFAVDARRLHIVDIGTAFDVRLDAADAVEVAVREGRVAVSQDGTAAPAVALGAGDWLRQSGNAAPLRGQESTDTTGAWTMGRLVAEDRSIGDILAALRPYLPGAIIVADRGLAAEHLTGVYDLTRPAEALRAVALAGGGRLHRLGPWLAILTGG